MPVSSGQQTVTWDEVYNSWTSFHSYVPEWMERLGTNFFTFKNGELYIHDENSSRTNFYGTSYGCLVKYSSNQEPSDIKVFKTVGLETNSDNWYSVLSSELETGQIGSSSNYLFEDKEGIRYSHIRRTSGDANNYNKLSILGLGELQAIDSSTFSFTNNIPNQVSANNADGVGGDKLWFLSSGSNNEIGVVDSIDGTDITVASITNTPSVGDFCYIVKDSEVESYGLRGYHATITLLNDSTGFVELYGANSEAFKSYM